jgi:magnesium-transporting ATPase (P-type)
MPIWKKDGGFDRRFSGGCGMIILVPLLVLGGGASLFFIGDFMQNDSALFVKIIHVLIVFIIISILLVICLLVTKGVYEEYQIRGDKPYLNIFKMLRIISFLLFVFPIFFISIIISMWVFDVSFMSQGPCGKNSCASELLGLGFLELFGWISITFFVLSIHSVITKFNPVNFGGELLDSTATIKCAIFLFVIGFLISLFAEMPYFYEKLISS